MAHDVKPLERAAIALHRARMAAQHPKPDNFPWEDLTPKAQALLRRDAYVVIKAIREPADAQIAAAASCESSVVADVYTSMIDALLGGPLD